MSPSLPLSESILAARDAVYSRAKATSQAGIFEGANPAEYNANNPLQLWIIQIIIIIGFTQILALILGRIRQPRVISEVIGGIILGPSIMGRIPNFSNSIFPSNGMPLLNLTANIGLVLFLFIIGLEVDIRIIKKSWKSSSAISAAGLIIPLGLGAALAVPIYREFIDPSINYGYFILFTAVAIGITAFPVLCRILTELKLLNTTVGLVTLSAGVGNDIVGWILLALTVALVNAGNGIQALYVLLTGLAFTLFMLFLVKPAFRWLVRRTGDLESGHPSTLAMTVILLITFVSALFTDVIGIQALFGGFLAGLVIPHDNGFAISVVEKFEDLVSILFLPLYFTFSGLKTNLGLLDNGKTWGYTFLICAVAFFSKFLGCGVTAKLSGYNWRESGAIGSLMSCKGLVELIVLNVGLQAGILDTRSFSMFVIHAVFVTFITTPLVLLFYPEEHRNNSLTPRASDPEDPLVNTDEDIKTRFAIVLDSLNNLPAAMTVAQLLHAPPVLVSKASGFSSPSEEKVSAEDMSPAASSSSYTPRPVSVDALRLIELTTRTSAVLKSQEADSLVRQDPLISAFRAFGRLNRLNISAALSVVGYDEFSHSVTKHAESCAAQLLVIPWTQSTLQASSGLPASPFDSVFQQQPQTSDSDIQEENVPMVYSDFIRRVFSTAKIDAALFVDRHAAQATDGQQRLIVPFIGGADDRLALSFAVQICMNSNFHATVIRLKKVDDVDSDDASSIADMRKTPSDTAQNTAHVSPDTVYPNPDTQTRMQSDTADDLLWERLTITTAAAASPHSAPVASALTRITFTESASPRPLQTVVEHVATSGQNLVVLGRSRRRAVGAAQDTELKRILARHGASLSAGSELAKTVGDLGAALIVAGTPANLLVMQARS